jgi:hypothetical protein
MNYESVVGKFLITLMICFYPVIIISPAKIKQSG